VFCGLAIIFFRLIHCFRLGFFFDTKSPNKPPMLHSIIAVINCKPTKVTKPLNPGKSLPLPRSCHIEFSIPNIIAEGTAKRVDRMTFLSLAIADVINAPISGEAIDSKPIYQFSNVSIPHKDSQDTMAITITPIRNAFIFSFIVLFIHRTIAMSRRATEASSKPNQLYSRSASMGLLRLLSFCCFLFILLLHRYAPVKAKI